MFLSSTDLLNDDEFCFSILPVKDIACVRHTSNMDAARGGTKAPAHLATLFPELATTARKEASLSGVCLLLSET